jgi:DNA-directed RNA polymerase specialized sigma24 family protein
MAASHRDQRGSQRLPEAETSADLESLEADSRLVTRSDPRDGLLLRRVVQSLPLDAQRLFVLHYVMGYSHRQISAALGIAVGTSKSQLHAARHRLRRLLTAPYASPVAALTR